MLMAWILDVTGGGWNIRNCHFCFHHIVIFRRSQSCFERRRLVDLGLFTRLQENAFLLHIAFILSRLCTTRNCSEWNQISCSDWRPVCMKWLTPFNLCIFVRNSKTWSNSWRDFSQLFSLRICSFDLRPCTVWIELSFAPVRIYQKLPARFQRTVFFVWGCISS